MSNIVRTTSLTVASGATVSNEFVAGGFNAFGLIIPSTFDGTGITFEVGYSDVGTMNWMGLYNLATTVTMVVAASRAYKLPDDLKPFPYWRMLTAAQTGATVFVAFGKSEA